MEDLLYDGLQDIYYAEQQIIKSLPKMIEKATNRDLIAGLKGHLEETNKQVGRLEKAFEKLGKQPSGTQCPAIDGIIKEADETAGEIEDKAVLAYPFVTSSNPIAGAACVGAAWAQGHRRGLGYYEGLCDARRVRAVSDRDRGELGDRIRERGHEVGTTTGRPRRCGWLDLVALRYAARINGLTGLAITKLDVLSGIDPLPVAVRYLGPDGATFDTFPYHQSIVHKAEGDYEELPGWEEDIVGARGLEDLPQAARDYLDYISEFVGVPVTLVSVGPSRDQVIWTGVGTELRAVA